jgi:hypothetical protein
MGWQAMFNGNGADSCVAVGREALEACTGDFNTALGYQAGQLITTGTKNTIIGTYNGNEGGLDIRTLSNRIVLSDGDGNPRGYWSGEWNFKAGLSSGYLMKITNSASTNPYGLQISFSGAADDDNNEMFIACGDTAATRFQVTNQGDVRNHDNSYGAISDVKLKEQITDASSQWDDIKALTVRKYKMKQDVSIKGDSDEHWRLGVVAQEVEEAGMGGLVTTDIDRDEEMNDLGTTTKSIKYSILYMKAVKALQEAMERIETLEAKVTALENG